MKINEKHKDRLFCLIFGKEKYKDNLLSLYNAVNGTDYTNVNDIEINTIDDAIYMKMKNDVSCIMSSTLSLYEQQSTYNPNMAFRDFEYCANLYSKIVTQNNLNIYGTKLVRIPAPQCHVFYIGEAEHDDVEVLKLSDAFEHYVEGYEWTTIMHNINGGHNQALLDKCRPLSEYSMLIMRIRDNRESMPLVEAVDEAVRYMINQNGVLSGVLSDNRSEVVNMIITEYNEELHMKSVYQDGVEEGIEKESKRIFLNMLSSGLNIEKAIEYAGITREQAEKIIAN